MPEETSQPASRRKAFRLILWSLLAGLLVVFLATSLWPDLDLSGQDRIALIRVEGVILDAQQTVGDLKKFGDSPSVKAIVLRIDSPGGGVVPSQEIHDAVMRVRNKQNKAVVASMGTVAASGGYYIAAATDRIMANPGTLTGSIGVIMELANLEGLLKKIGVENVVVKSGRHKDIGSPFRKMSDEDRRILQSVMDDVHTQFIEAVAEGRSLDREALRLLRRELRRAEALQVAGRALRHRDLSRRRLAERLEQAAVPAAAATESLAALERTGASHRRESA